MEVRLGKLTYNTSDQHCLSLGQLGMGFRRHESVTERDEALHVPVDEVKRIECEKPGKHKMCPVATLVLFAYVAKGETLKALSFPTRVDCVDGKQNDPA